MRSNNFIEIKINTKHVFLGRLPPTPTALTFLLTQTPGVHRPSPSALATLRVCHGVGHDVDDHQKRWERPTV